MLIQVMDILNTVSILSGQLTFISETYELLTKSCTVCFVVREYSMRNYMFTCKSQL